MISGKKFNFKKAKLYIIENRKAFISFFVLAFILILFLLSFYNINSQYLNEINNGHYDDLTGITNNLFHTYFYIILYTAIYIVCAVVFLGMQLKGESDFRLILVIWYLVLLLFSKINDINVSMTVFQSFIAMISDSIYELSTIPLLLYITLKMKENSRHMQLILLLECVSSLLYVIGYGVNSSNIFSILKTIGCSFIFVVTVLVIHVFVIIEIKNKNIELRTYLFTELGIALIFMVICAFSFLMPGDFSSQLKNGFSALISNLDLLPLRKLIIQDVIAIAVFLDYCIAAFGQYIASVEKNKSIQTELTLSEGYNEIAQVRIREVRKLKHDIKEHINMAYMYCQSEDYQKLKEYLETLGADMAALPSLAYCNNVPSNHILMYYSEKAKNKGIEFNATASTGENIGLTDSEATSLLSNLLKNAYEACVNYSSQGNEKPYINFNMHIKNSKIYIFCENSSPLSVQKDKSGRFKTTKSNALEHGLGIAIVENICESHNGAAVFEHIGNKFTANAIIPVNLD